VLLVPHGKGRVPVAGMSAHKFKIGQHVNYNPRGPSGRGVPRSDHPTGVYQIAQLMPPAGDEPQYRIKSVLVNAPWLRTIPVKAAYVRPRVYGGDQVTSITVTAVFRKPR
jgi:hypothetical protein